MKKFKFWNALCGWLVFAVAAATYLLTMEPTASFWDCGEFISSAVKLDVGHPPGAPFFMLMGHFFSLFTSDLELKAMCVNALSALASAFTILFLFWTITALAKKLMISAQEQMPMWKGIGILAAGAVGALAYTFSDTFWFSAVEGEVYASSSLFTALVFWLILKWDEHADEEGSDRWLIAIAYLMGLSIGVHLLNLLTIPAIGLVYYFRRYRATIWGTVVAFLISCVVLAVVLYGIIPGVPTVLGWFELLFVNHLNCPFNTGLAVCIVLTTILLAAAIIVTHILAKRTKHELWRWLNTGVLMLTVILIGYSSYAALVIRSAADTPMDQNSPDNVFSLKYYLNREQYGDRPLFYGQTYNAPVELRIEGNMCIPVEKVGHAQYAPAPKEEGKPDRYVVTGHKTSYKYMDEFCMLFPRMYSPSGNHVQAYKEWADVSGKRIKYDYCGQKRVEQCPTFEENLRFFFRYQVNFMYWRYFMWNFSGRQNDLQSYGEITKGNWITGFPLIDNAMLGDQSKLPTELKENKGHNVYYMLPLLLGIIGMLWQVTKRRKSAQTVNTEKVDTVLNRVISIVINVIACIAVMVAMTMSIKATLIVLAILALIDIFLFLVKNPEAEGARSFLLTFLLFFLTGLAIVVYLNQTPYQPRERDYAYAGSFYAFCIWIGLGALALIDWLSYLLSKKWMKTVVAIFIGLICLLVPAQMASQNWDDHDRSQRYSCRDFGANYLKSCETQAILFSNGDNDTFPLWYNQEVEEVGTDLRVCNLSYLQTDWYISQMKRPYYQSEALPISWEYKDFMPGKNEIARVENRSDQAISIETAFQFLRDPRFRTKEGYGYLPTNQLYVETPSGERIFFKRKNMYTRSEMMIMEMLSTNKWQRPMYFCATVGNDYYLGLEPYMELTGLAYQITPTRSRDGQPRVNTEKMYENMMHQFKYGNMNIPGIYIDENLMRMCRTHRMMFAQLAEQLIRENQRDKALEVLDYAEEMLPGYNISYDYTSASMAQMYFMLGQEDKAVVILESVAQNSVEYLRFIRSLDRLQRKAMNGTAEREAAILGYVLQTLERYGKTEIVDKYYEDYATAAR